jgi:hypothetical protein
MAVYWLVQTPFPLFSPQELPRNHSEVGTYTYLGPYGTIEEGC